MNLEERPLPIGFEKTTIAVEPVITDMVASTIDIPWPFRRD